MNENSIQSDSSFPVHKIDNKESLHYLTRKQSELSYPILTYHQQASFTEDQLYPFIPQTA